MKYIVAGIVGLGILGGCINAGIPSTQEELPQPPSRSEILRMVTLSYQSDRGRAPRDLQIVKIGSDNYIGQNQWDYYACMSLTEAAEFPTYDNNGGLIRDTGDDYTSDLFYHLRLYDHGWGSGFMRRIHQGTKVGRRQARDLCPAQ